MEAGDAIVAVLHELLSLASGGIRGSEKSEVSRRYRAFIITPKTYSQLTPIFRQDGDSV